MPGSATVRRGRLRGGGCRSTRIGYWMTIFGKAWL